MVTVECSSPCKYCESSSPIGVHYHHWHSISDPDCIIHYAQSNGLGNFTCSETEYHSLVSLAEKLHLSHSVIDELSKGYHDAHKHCPSETLRRGYWVGAVCAMFWHASIAKYYKMGRLIKMTEKGYYKYPTDLIFEIKDPYCPICASKNIVGIFYGYQGDMDNIPVDLMDAVKRAGAEFGRHSKNGNDPKWRCKRCNHGW